MAVVGQTYLTLADMYKRSDNQGKVVAQIIEMMSQANPILEDMIAKEANEGATNLATIRSGLPEATFRKLYQGVQPSKSTTIQVRDTTGMAESWSEIDAALVDLAGQGNAGSVRITEATAFLESLAQAVGQRMFYGNSATDPAEFLGLAPRFSSLNAPNGKQIIDAGGTGNDNTSIWFVVWGDATVHGIYPKGTPAGIQRDDKGKQTKTLADGTMYDVYREKFGMNIGLTVKDWRYVARVANIDVKDMQAGNVKLYDFLRKAYYRLQQRKTIGGKAAIYCNTDVLETLDALATNAGAKDNFVRLTRKDVEGQEVLSYRGIPIRETDSLLNTEERVI